MNACGPIDYRTQQRERWIEKLEKLQSENFWRGYPLTPVEIVDALQADLHEQDMQSETLVLAQEVERLKAELEAEQALARRVTDEMPGKPGDPE